MKRIIHNYCEKCGNFPELLVRLAVDKIQVGSEMATFTSVNFLNPAFQHFKSIDTGRKRVIFKRLQRTLQFTCFWEGVILHSFFFQEPVRTIGPTALSSQSLFNLSMMLPLPGIKVIHICAKSISSPSQVRRFYLER